MMVSHALGINLEGDGNEILLTRENGSKGGKGPSLLPRKVCIFRDKIGRIAAGREGA